MENNLLDVNHILIKLGFYYLLIFIRSSSKVWDSPRLLQNHGSKRKDGKGYKVKCKLV